LDISAPDSAIKVFIIPTDEERVIIEDVVALLNGTYDEHMRFEYPFQKADYQNRQRVEEFERECEKKPYMRDIEAKIPKK
jgi:acetate kinase